MPFSKNPTIQTYETKQIKLVQEWETRDKSGTKDNDTVNCFYEIVRNKKTGENDHYVISRNGTTVYPTTTLASYLIRGIYYVKALDYLYVAVDASVKVFQGATGVELATINTGFGFTFSEVGFTEFNYDIGVIKLIVTNGTVLGTIDSTHNFVVCTSPTLPVPHLPYPVFMDGYLFVTKKGTADIYNSNLNDPLTWPAGSFISSEILPDNLLRISRLNNYIVAFGSSSIEYFWDAGNPTASPLQRNDTPVKLVGYRGGLTHWGNKIFFVGDTDSTTAEVFMIEDFKIESLGKPPIRRLVESSPIIYGTVVSFSGHDFYVLTVNAFTYMVDLETKLWTRLKYKQNGNMPIAYSTVVPINNTGCCVFYNTAQSRLDYFNPDVYYDDGVEFNPTVITDNEYFDSYNNKFCNRLTVVADRPSTDTSAYVDVSWTDDDFQSFSTPRRVALNQELPALTALGKFRRRAHKIVHTGSARFRLLSLEVNINKGIR